MKARAARRRRGPPNCEELLQRQEQGHKETLVRIERGHQRTMEAHIEALRLAQEAADRASERRDNTMRFLLAAAIVILGGLVGIKLTGLSFAGF